MRLDDEDQSPHCILFIPGDFLIRLWPDPQVADLGARVQQAAGASLWNPNLQPFPGKEAGHREGCELPYIAWLAASGSRSPVL